MQVNPLAVRDVLSSTGRLTGLLAALTSQATSVPRPQGKQAVRELAQHRAEKEAAFAALVPTRPADIVADAERNVERSSRAFRRQTAREAATEHFREGRQSLRQALADAKGKQPNATLHRPAPATPGSAKGAPTSANTSPSGGAATQRADGRGGSGSASTSPSSTAGSQSQAGVSPNLAGRTGVPPGTAAVATPGVPGAASTPAVGTRAPVTSPVAARGVPSSQLPAVRTGGSGGGRGASAVTSAARTATKLAGPSTAKAGASQPADSAARQANIERIVRVVRSQMNGERAHTVMRLDPPELGRLRLQLDLRGAGLSLRVDTSTEVAQRLLTEDVDKLRHGLEASGIQLERIDIRGPAVSPSANEHDPPQHAESEPEAQARAQHESADTDAEHPQEQGRDSHPAEAPEGAPRGAAPGLATESLVNLVA
jgi:flagellar hook-length control protein FliK